MKIPAKNKSMQAVNDVLILCFLSVVLRRLLYKKPETDPLNESDYDSIFKSHIKIAYLNQVELEIRG